MENMNQVLLYSGLILILILGVSCQGAQNDSERCTSTYQELKESLRSNYTDNVQKMLNVFYPPNKSPSHVVFIRYCIRDDFTLDPVTNKYTDECESESANYEFQWLSNTVPLLIDPDVFMANTFNFADLNVLNLSLTIDPFCNNTDTLLKLETLTTWLKSYAQGEEDTIESYSISIFDEDNEDEGYLGIFEINGTRVTFIEKRLFASGRKLVIGLWLGTTSITVALILHIGRVSAKTANALNRVLLEIAETINKIILMPSKTLQFMRGVVTSESQNVKNAAKQDKTPKPPDDDMNEDDDEAGIALTEISNASAISDDTNSDHVVSSSQTDGIKYDLESASVKKARQKRKLDHAFVNFTRIIQKLSTVSAIVLLAFLAYDVYIYSRFARRLSYDWLVLFPFPAWFILIVLINLITFIITESILCYREIKKRRPSVCTILIKLVYDLLVAMSASTAPLFIFFHVFWLILAVVAFSVRILSSAIFYLPLAIFFMWLLAVLTELFNQWKKLEFNPGRKLSKPRAVCHIIGQFLYTLIPVLFLPFWILLLATLHFLSDFLLEIVNLDTHSLLLVLVAIILITIATRKIAKHCLPHAPED